MKKKIGISFTKTNFQHYWNWFSDLDGYGELIELSFVKNNTAEFSLCDGFILTGGVDIDPSIYKGSKLYDNPPDSFQAERDRFESAMFQFSQDHRLPLLGICRGLQLVNVLQGGTLLQDLGPASNDVHRKKEMDKQHEIAIEKDSLLYEITGMREASVNSAHHQGIDQLGEGLMSNCRASDGIIEGLEWKDKKGKAFMLCVQWHPERMFIMQWHDSPVSRGIRERFVQEIEHKQRSI